MEAKVAGGLLKYIMKKFLLAFVVLLFFGQAQAATIYLGIGVNYKVKVDDYAPEIENLHKLIKPAKHHHILGSDATLTNITKGLEWLNDTATAADTSIVYISAHGYYDKGYRFSGYNAEKIPGILLASYLNLTKGKVILIVDTCHSGGILREQWNKNVAVLAACGENESSWGRYFCEQLYEALKQVRPISTRDIESYITHNIATKKQVPVYKNTDIVLTTVQFTPIAWQYNR